MSPSEIPAPDAVRRVVRLIATHPEVVSVEDPVFEPEGGGHKVELIVRVSLPTRWLAEGASPSGVRGLESVSLLFPPEYPVKPPIPYLRADFDRSYPHLQPGPADRPPQPCLVDGDLGELLHHRGLVGILDQLVEWLNRAAMDRLIGPEQGWEPVRRDGVADFIIANADELRSWVDQRGGFIFLPMRYGALPSLTKDREEDCGAIRYVAIVTQRPRALRSRAFRRRLVVSWSRCACGHPPSSYPRSPI